MARVAVALAFVVAGLAITAPSARAQKSEDRAKAKVHADRARAARDAKQWSAAAAEYEAAYQYHPDPKYMFNIGLSYDLAGDKQKAVQAFRAYISKDPKGRYATTARAKLEELDKAIAKERERAHNAQLQQHLANAKRYTGDGRHDAAAFEYEKSYELTDNTEYLFESAESHRRMGSKDRAIAAYKAYLKADASGKFSVSAQRHLKSLEGPPSAKQAPAAAPVAAPTDKPKKKKKKKSSKRWIWYTVGAVVLVGVIVAIAASGGDGGDDYYYRVLPDVRPTPVVPPGLYGR